MTVVGMAIVWLGALISFGANIYRPLAQRHRTGWDAVKVADRAARIAIVGAGIALIGLLIVVVSVL